MNFIEQALEKLRGADYKVTGPRMAVLEILSGTLTPLSAYEIQERVPENIPINVVTIYRVLEVFEKLGLIHRIHSKEGYVPCGFESKKGCHSFAICQECKRTEEFISKQCKIEKLTPKNLSFGHLKHLSEIIGLCRYCA